MIVNEHEELFEDINIPIDEFFNIINEAKKRFEKRGCKDIQISIAGDYEGNAVLNIEGSRLATEEEIKEKQIRDKQIVAGGKKVKIVYEPRNIS